jgi:hypothetical protein
MGVDAQEVTGVRVLRTAAVLGTGFSAGAGSNNHIKRLLERELLPARCWPLAARWRLAAPGVRLGARGPEP